MQFWGDQFLAALRDMLGEACRERTIPDCEFFLNKRDYPQLKINVERGVPVEPYGFIFDKDDRDPAQDVDLVEEHKFNSYAPIVSFYAANETRFSDIPWPSSEDWEGACKEHHLDASSIDDFFKVSPRLTHMFWSVISNFNDRRSCISRHIYAYQRC